MTFHKKLIRFAVGGVAFLGLAASASAHYLWIERDAKSARLYFGEVAEVRETSPGRMDEMPAPNARALSKVGAPAELLVKKGPRYFSLEGALTDQLVVTETGYVVKDWSKSGIGIVKPMFYARHSAWPVKTAALAAPDMKLDVMPVLGVKNGFVVMFDGKPLAKNKVMLYAPNDWEKEYKTDDKGAVVMPLPWRGQYVVEVIFKEPSAGEFGGQKYEAIRHRATLTMVQPGGLSAKGTGGGVSGVPMQGEPMMGKAMTAQPMVMN